MSSVLRKDIIFIGVGLCGCRQVKELMDRGFEGFLLNTSETDFRLVGEVQENRKYKIPDADGVNKNQDKALQLFGSRIDEISQYVLKDHSSFKHYVFVFSLGGGSGSGGAPALAQHFGYTFEQDGRDKTVSIIGTSPDEKDGMEALENAKACIHRIETEYTAITSRIYLDNSAMKDKFAINTQIADLISGLMELPSVDESLDTKLFERNGMKQSDGEEALSLWRTQGCINMAIINPEKMIKDKKGETALVDPVVFMPHYAKKPVQMAVSASHQLKLDGDNGEAIRKELIATLGQYGSDIKAGYNASDISYAYTFGHKLPQSFISNLNTMIDNIAKNVNTDDEESELDFGSTTGGYQSLFGSKPVAKTPATSPFASLTKGNTSGSPFGKSSALGNRK